jgi:hypothetical protein
MKIKTNHVIPVVLLATLLVLLSVNTSATMLIPASDTAKSHTKATSYSPVIDTNWGLERIDFIHYLKPPNAAVVKTESCYKLLGVKWKTFPVSYVINPSNPQGLTETFITSALSSAAETWDAATSKELFNNIYTIDYNAKYGVQDFVNTLAFGDYPDDNVIAITSVWYTPVSRAIVEFDTLFNTRFVWGDATVDPTKMDLQNIATHELGHGIGLGDIYSSTCSEVTMYGYSSYGETKKRTLEQPDITGLQKMYGV